MFKKFINTSIKEFAELFRRILENRVATTEPGLQERRPCLWILGTGSRIEVGEGPSALRHVAFGSPEPDVKSPTLVIGGPGFDAYLRLVGLLGSTEKIGEYLGEEFIMDSVNRELQRLAVFCPADADAWDARVRAFLQGLRSLQVGHTVYLPVMNLKLAAELQVGNVNFLTPDIVADVLRPAVAQSYEGKSNPPDQLAEIKSQSARILALYERATCCATVTVHCHESKAQQLGAEAAREAINLLRCYIPFLFGIGSSHRIGLADETSRIRVPRIAIDEAGTTHVGSEVAGGVQDYEIEGQILEILRDFGAFELLSRVLAKPVGERTELEASLAKAIWWIGSGNHRMNPEDQVVALVTGLEALLIDPKNKHEDKANSVSRRAAHLLGPAPDRRKSIFSKIKALYDLRSQVVHTGRIEIPATDLDDLKYYALATLVEMAKRAQGGWKTVQDLAGAVASAEWGGEPINGGLKILPRGPIRATISTRISSGGDGCIVKY